MLGTGAWPGSRGIFTSLVIYSFIGIALLAFAMAAVAFEICSIPFKIGNKIRAFRKRH